MITSYPVAPKQPRRVPSGQRTPVRDVPGTTIRNPRRVPSGQRQPIGPQPVEAPGPRPGSQRRVSPPYATRRR